MNAHISVLHYKKEQSPTNLWRQGLECWETFLFSQSWDPRNISHCHNDVDLVENLLYTQPQESENKNESVTKSMFLYNINGHHINTTMLVSVITQCGIGLVVIGAKKNLIWLDIFFRNFYNDRTFDSSLFYSIS